MTAPKDRPAEEPTQDDACAAPSCSESGCTPQRLGAAPDDAVLSVRDLSVRYDGTAVLEHVDLDMRAGRVTALIGPSGSGKTSFLYCLNQLSTMVRGCEVSGGIRFEGRDVRGGDSSWLRRNVGMVFQRPNPFPVSIRKNLHLPLEEHGCDKRDLALRTEEALRDVGLWDEVKDRLDAPAMSLSGGQQQRLCIARALTLRPKMLLMDEPCSALDPLATEVIEGLVQKMRGSFSIVIVTHNLAQARRVADDVAVFWCYDGHGCLIESGTADRVFLSPQREDTRNYLAGLSG